MGCKQATQLERNMWTRWVTPVQSQYFHSIYCPFQKRTREYIVRIFSGRLQSLCLEINTNQHWTMFWFDQISVLGLLGAISIFVNVYRASVQRTCINGKQANGFLSADVISDGN